MTRILAFDTSTEALSVALADGAQVWRADEAGGAKASARLIPAIEGLMREAGLRYDQLDAIAFGAGPGSFTGLRTACSVAQGLGFGAGVRLLPIDSLLAVAEDARQRHGARRILAALDARMNQLYVARYQFAEDGSYEQSGDFALVAPEALVTGGHVLAGNALAAYRDRLPADALQGALESLPTAVAMLRLAPRLIEAGATVAPEDALPRYVRDKVAQTTLERMAAAKQ
ncbi:MAG: tRNA (adenosine(37)-N6)-threonylcarbamoyltransferase complex dimerization subunit type 1 TsaB [Burkholderiales bacterium]